MHVSDADFDEVKRGLAKVALPETSGFRAEAARVLAAAAGRKPAIMACAMDFVQRASRIGGEAGVVTSRGDAEAREGSAPQFLPSTGSCGTERFLPWGSPRLT